MNIEFQSKGLEDLYFFGSTEEKTYSRLSKDIIKRYIKVVNYLKAQRMNKTLL